MTTLPTSDRFFAVEISKCFWLPAIADAEDLIPTRIEISAGTELALEIVDMSGWDPTPNAFAVNTLGSRFSPSLTGRTSMQAASIVFAASVDGQDVRQVLDVGDSGFVLWADGGDEEDYPADVFPARVSAISPMRTVAEQEHRLTVSFSIPNRPRHITLPPAT